MIRKRLLSACLALALCLSLLPVTAEAAAEGAPSQLYVGNYLITNSGTTTYLKAGSTQGSLEEGSETDWTVKYDPSTATLTLSGATIKGGSDVASIPYGAGIYAQCSNGQSVTLTIELIGENTITGTFGIYVNAEINASSYGTNATLTIMGDNNGSLEVSGSNNGIYVKSGTGNASLNIKNVAVTSSTNDNYAAGVYVMSSNYATNSPNISLSVDGGSLTASGTGSRDGILFYVGSSQATGATTSLTVSENAIVDARNGGISALKISETLPTPTPTGDNRSGIVFDGNTGTVYGAVTLQEDLTIGEGERLNIPSGASLTIDSGATLTNEGTVTNSGTLTNNGTINNSGTLPGNIQGAAPPSITTTSLDDGTVGAAYNETLEPNSQGYTWAVASGSLPDGLTLDGNTGVISGTPTADGTFNFTVTATNTGGSDSEQLSITIDTTAPTLTTGSATRTGEATATVTFTSSEAGTYYYAVVESGASAPSDLTTSGTSGQCNVGTNTITLTNLTTGAKDIYIVVKDAANNESQPLNMTIPDYVAPSYGISVTPSALNFGSVNAGYTTAPTAQTVTITNTGNQSVTVDLPTSTNYTITAGTGFTSGTATITQNGTAQFTVQPKTGLAAGSYNETLAISGDNDVGATVGLSFTVNPKLYTVTVLTDGKGSASASPATAAAGTTVTLTAKPDSGYRLAHWEVVEGDVTISGNSFTMPAENVTVRAVFSPVVNIPDTYDIDLIVGEGGEAKLSLTNASAGSTITVTATPDEGFKLDYITVDGERIDGTTFTMPNHDVTVRVYFTDGAALPFTDVSAGAWYFDAVGYVYVGGLMDGVSDTLFDPDGTMTRAMVWAILARVDGETVTGDGWIETAREWAVAEGVSDGENATDYVTREQFATMLWRYAGEPETDGSGVGVFDDGETVSIWAFDAMSWALNNGVITGVSDDALLPANTATRAQCAAMLMRFVEAIG